MLTVLKHVANPHKFKGTAREDRHGGITDSLPQRVWANYLGLACHKDWAKRWRKRYDNFLNDVTILDIVGVDEITRQL